MENKHTIEEFMCWRRENLLSIIENISVRLGYSLQEVLAATAVDLCDKLDENETPITIVTESGGRYVDTSDL